MQRSWLALAETLVRNFTCTYKSTALHLHLHLHLNSESTKERVRNREYKTENTKQHATMDFPHNIHTVQALPPPPLFNLLLLLILFACIMPLTHRDSPRNEENLFEDFHVEAVAPAVPREFSAYARHLAIKHSEKELQQKAKDSVRLYSILAFATFIAALSSIAYIYFAWQHYRNVPPPPNLVSQPVHYELVHY